MQKSLRSFALAAALALTVAPSAFANQTGCNPHPQTPPPPPPPKTAVVYLNAILSLFGA